MIIADTGFWLALANRRDAYHQRAQELLQALDEELITTWPVVTETCHLLVSRLGTAAEVAFIASARLGAFKIFDLTQAHLERVEALMVKYRNLPMDLADASLVLLAEELGTGRIYSNGRRDFGAYRWKERKPFKNLLCPG